MSTALRSRRSPSKAPRPATCRQERRRPHRWPVSLFQQAAEPAEPQAGTWPQALARSMRDEHTPSGGPSASCNGKQAGLVWTIPGLEGTLIGVDGVIVV